MQEFNISELHPHPRNSEFFDDITGGKWDELLDSIRQRVSEGKRGNIEPIIITQDKTIVSGHQRVRAFQELGIPTIEAEVKIYSNDDEVLRDLLESNIRRRGEVGGSAKKVGLRIRELERLYGIQHGGDHNQGEKNSSCKSQSDLAEQLEMDVRTLQNYKLLADMIPELDELVTTGIVTKTTALAIMKELSPAEQEEFVSQLDVTERITQRQAQEYIAEIKHLKEAAKPEVVVQTVEKIVDKTDYKQIDKLSAENRAYANRISTLVQEKNLLERRLEHTEEEAEKYNKLKSEIDFLTKQKDDLGRRLNSATELAGLTSSLQRTLENDLAPIKFKRCMDVLDVSEVALRNLVTIVKMVDNWLVEIKSYLPIDEKNIVDI